MHIEHMNSCVHGSGITEAINPQERQPRVRGFQAESLFCKPFQGFKQSQNIPQTSSFHN